VSALVRECGGEEPLTEEFYVSGAGVLGSQLTGRSWEAEPPRPASLQDTLTRLIRLGEGNLSQCCGTGTVTFCLVEPEQ
jgi:hypothetical protein